MCYKTPVDRMTLRDAAERTGLSVTTLRRYIRSGRLTAEKAPGRFGPEYLLSHPALEQAGIALSSNGDRRRPAEIRASHSAESRRDANIGSSKSEGALVPASALGGVCVSESFLRETVPLDLYRELSLKHEQLLVQYGMVRVGGQKLMEFKAEAERLAEALQTAEDSARAERDRYAREVGFLKTHLRQAELEIEERNQELAALRERVRILELVHRNSITTESIDRQITRVLDKRLELEELEAVSSDERRRRVAEFEEVLRSGLRPRHKDLPTDQ